MEILFDSRQTKLSINHEALLKKTERILEKLGRSEGTVVSLSLVEAQEMSELNKRYRGKEGPTNVLAFSQLEGDTTTYQPDLLGDVVICVDRVIADADELGYTTEEMLVYLLIHGLLHLVGYAHDTPLDEATMTAEVERIFNECYPLSP